MTKYSLPVEIAVLIPCYNEGLTIGAVVKEFQTALPGATIYVYDNNSTDDTVVVASQAGAQVYHEEMQGKGHVVRRMFRDIEADLYILVDGDDTYDAAMAPEMVDIALEGPYDLVNGVRVSTAFDASYRKWHRLGNRLLTGAVRILFGNRIIDMLSGYKVLSRRFVKSFPAQSGGFEIETELTVHALELAMPIAHVEGGYRGRPEGSNSKLRTYRDGLRIVSLILVLFKQEKPLMFFTLIGALLGMCSLGLGIPVVADYLKTGKVPRLPTAVLSMGIMLAAFLSVNSGIILDTVTQGRWETKMLRYLGIPATQVSKRNLPKMARSRLRRGNGHNTNTGEQAQIPGSGGFSTGA